MRHVSDYEEIISLSLSPTPPGPLVHSSSSQFKARKKLEMPIMKNCMVSMNITLVFLGKKIKHIGVRIDNNAVMKII